MLDTASLDYAALVVHIRLHPKLRARHFRPPDPAWWQSVDPIELDAWWSGDVAADGLTGLLKLATHSIVRQIHDACAALGLEHVLIGASARDIMLTHIFGRAIRRATRDLDVAVAVPDWQSFDGIMSWLLQRLGGWSRSPTMRHRLLYRTADAMEVPLDIIPCGGVEDPPATIS